MTKLAFALCAMLLFSVAPAHAYSIANVSIQGICMNESGQIGGETTGTLALGGEAALWSAGSTTLLGALPPFAPTSLQSSSVYAINDSAQCVGYTMDLDTATWITRTEACRFDAGAVTPLGTLGYSSRAYGINSYGMIVGDSQPGEVLEPRAFIWKGFMWDIGTLPGGWTAGARAVNDYARVVGWSSTSTLSVLPFLYNHDTGVMSALSTLGGANGGASDINNSGYIVGESELPSGARRACRWSPSGVLLNLGTLGGTSTARAINKHGVIVGASEIAGVGWRGWVWSAPLGMQNLNTLTTLPAGWVITNALDIVADGRILARVDTPYGVKTVVLVP